MITCPKCNRELSDDVKFCNGCGCPVPETTFCPNCGEQAIAGFAFCRKCGAPIAEAPVAEPPAAADEKKKKFPKKAIIFGGIGVAAVAVLVIVIALILGGKAKNNYFLYLKENELFFTDLKKNGEPHQLTSELLSDTDISTDELIYSSVQIGRCTYMSKDGKYIFFPDKLGDSKTGFSLYYKEVSDLDEKAVKIDSDIRVYAVNDSATLVTYRKGSEGELYRYNIRKGSKEKLASEVANFAVSEDGRTVIYINFENSIYVRYDGDKKEKLASEVSVPLYITEDLSAVYYMKDGSLYKQVVGGDKEKISSDVCKVLGIYESGEVYYLTERSEKIGISDYVIDDMKDADASVTEPGYPMYPEEPSYPYWEDYDTDEEYNAAYDEYEAAYDAWEAECERLEAEYNAAVEAYRAKLLRDELRKDLNEITLSKTAYSLCFYDGSGSSVVTDAYYRKLEQAEDAPVLFYSAYKPTEPEKVKLSELENAKEVEGAVSDAMFSSYEKYIAVGGNATVFEEKKEADELYININSSGTAIYYIDNIQNGKDFGELYCIKVSDGVPGTAELYDSDVCVNGCFFLSDTEFVYYKDMNDDKGELYINGNHIDSDVGAYRVGSVSDGGKTVYYTDWDDDKNYGTLKIYDGKESVKISDDVHGIVITPEGSILYLYDYSDKHSTGELYEWFDGKTRKIDDDVTCLLVFFEYDYRGLIYGE